MLYMQYIFFTCAIGDSIFEEQCHIIRVSSLKLVLFVNLSSM